MSVSLSIVLSAAGFGLAYNAAPGAVNTEAFRRGLARGARSALLVELGAMIGDATWAALALTGSAFLLQSRPISLVLGIAGACFLLRLAWHALQAARTPEMDAASSAGARGDFATGVVFSLANPFAFAFWAGVGSGITATTGGHAAPPIPVLLTGFVLGALAWCLFVPIAIGLGRRVVRPSTIRWVNALCGLALGYFGLRLLWSTVESIVQHPIARATSLIGDGLDRRTPLRGA